MKFVSPKMFPFYLFLLLITIVSQTNAQLDFNPVCANIKGNYTQNSTYHNNLKTLLSNLTSNTKITYGFYNFSYGENRDKVYAIGLCRGDVNPTYCRYCLKNSAKNLAQNCPNQMEAIGWFEECMMRYSNRSIFRLMETRPYNYMRIPNNATDVDRLGELLREIRNRATAGDSEIKYATGNTTGPNFEDIYALMQCTPDLDSLECDDCLGVAISDRPSWFGNKVGTRVVFPSCTIRYETYQFYGDAADNEVPPPSQLKPPPTSSTTNNTTSSSQGKGITPRTAIIIAVPIAVVVVVLLCSVCIYLRVKKKPRETIKSIKSRGTRSSLFDGNQGTGLS